MQRKPQNNHDGGRLFICTYSVSNQLFLTIMSGILQRRPLSINADASSIEIKPGVQHGRHPLTVKNTLSTAMSRMNNTCHPYEYVP